MVILQEFSENIMITLLYSLEFDHIVLIHWNIQYYPRVWNKIDEFLSCYTTQVRSLTLLSDIIYHAKACILCLIYSQLFMLDRIEYNAINIIKIMRAIFRRN